MKKAGVLFDMDGLMFDTQQLYDNANIEIARTVYGFEISREMLLAITGRSGEDLYKTVNRFRPELDAKEYIRRIFNHVAKKVETDLIIMPGLYDLLSWLSQQDVRIGLTSGSDRSIVENNLRCSGLRECFSGIICGDEIIAGKPNPEGYLKTAALIGCRPEDCYVLEDSPNGILAGHRAGCSVIMVPNGIEPDAEIRSLCAGIYPSLSEVRQAMEAGLL